MVPLNKLRGVGRTRGSGGWELSYRLSKIHFSQNCDHKSQINDCATGNRRVWYTLRRFCNWPKKRRTTHFGARPKSKFTADFCQASVFHQPEAQAREQRNSPSLALRVTGRRNITRQAKLAHGTHIHADHSTANFDGRLLVRCRSGTPVPDEIRSASSEPDPSLSCTECMTSRLASEMAATDNGGV